MIMNKNCDCNSIVASKHCPTCITCKDLPVPIGYSTYIVNVTTCNNCSKDTFSFSRTSANGEQEHTEDIVREETMKLLFNDQDIKRKNCICN